VSAAVPDGAGGWFIGGSFSAVEGATRPSLAHLLANGSLSSWHPTLEGGTVVALALRGRELFVGGVFTSVNGRPHRNLAALDAVTGAVLDWDPGIDGGVCCLLLHGRSLFVGGTFDTVGGEPHSNLARVDASSGAVAGWNGDTDGRVLAMSADQHALLVGGEFDQAGGQARNSVAALDLNTGNATEWDARLGPVRHYLYHGDYVWPYVGAIAVHRGTVYLGGWFTNVGDQARASFAALDVRTAQPRPFDARLTGYGDVVTAVAVRENTVYIGGGFGEVGGETRINLAALDASTGQVQRWNPRAAEQIFTRTYGTRSDHRITGVIDALVASDRAIYAGGRFTSMYVWQARSFLAAIDLTTGRATDWNPQAEGLAVTALDVLGDRVYMTGLFRSINGVPKDNLAAVDASRGALVDWEPGPAASGGAPLAQLPSGDDVTYTFFEPRIAIRGSAVYASGGFVESITGRERFHIAAFDTRTGALLPWNPGTDGPVSGMFVSGSTVYAGGIFGNFGGAPHYWLGAVDANSALALPWDPKPLAPPGPYYPLVQAFTRSGGSVFIGGVFGSMGGAPRRYLAAVDTLAGGVLPWDPDPDGTVFALATSGHTVWAGGEFNQMHAQPQPFLAALNDSTGRLLGEQVQLDGTVHALLVSGDELYVAGEFRSLDGFPRCGVARIHGPMAQSQAVALVGEETARAANIQLISVSPTPARGSAMLTFALSRAGPVSLDVFDLQGRWVESVLNRAQLSAGTHVASIRTDGLRPGCYLYRLNLEGASIANKLVVMR
jgi:hypothetical protein